MKKYSVFSIAIALTSIFLAFIYFSSCSSGGDPNVFPPGTTTMELPDGSVFEVTTPVEITIIVITDSSGLPEGSKITLVSLEGNLQPGDTVIISYTRETGFETDYKIAYIENGKWKSVDCTLSGDGKTLTAEVDHFSIWGILDVSEIVDIQITPPDGTERPVFDVRENTLGDLEVVPDSVHPGGNDIESGDDASQRKMTSDVAVMAATVLIALAAILATAIVVWTGNAPAVLGIEGPQLEPTLRRLTIGEPACAMTDAEISTLVFVNNTNVTIQVLLGPQGEEETLMVLEPGSQQGVEAHIGVRIRYSVDTNAEGFTGSGAYIEVPPGNMCRVPIQ